jgi:outer membrane biosynthesis protein TonB
MEQQEKRNRRIGFFTSLGIHAALLLLFLFAMAWRAPDPPLPEFGIILNVGFDDQGSGDVQSDQPATEPEVQVDDEPEEITPVEPQPVVEDKPVDKVEQTEVITSKVESPVVVEKKEEKVKEEPKPKEPEKLKTEFTKDDAKKSDQQATNKGEKTPSEGDDTDKTGNKGEPKGTLDPNGQYKGTPGGGGGGDGMSLSMSGWTWSKTPDTDIPDNESGRVVFEIECDDSGEIIGIKTLERGVNAATEQRLKSAIMKTSLMRTVDGGQIPERSKGTVTFVIKSR